MSTLQHTSIIAAACTMLTLPGCANSALRTDTNAASSATRPVVVAIGDSIMKGHGLNAAQAWPALLAATNHWKLMNLACDGAGFVKADDVHPTARGQEQLAKVIAGALRSAKLTI